MFDGIFMKMIGLVFAVATLVACSSGADNNTKADTEKPTCSFWDAEDCSCSGALKLIESSDKKECVDLNAQNICMNRTNGFQWALEQKDESLFRSCLNFKPTKKEDSSRFSIRIETKNPKNLKKFAIWADSHKEILSDLELLNAPTLMPTGEMLIVSQEKQTDFLVGKILDPTLWPMQGHVDMIDHLSPKIFADIDDLISYLEKPQEKILLDEKSFPKSEVVQALIAVYQSDWTTNYQVTKALTEAECAGSCRREYNLGVFGSYTAVLTEQLYKGSIYRTEIVLKDGTNAIVGSVSLAKKKPFMIHQFERNAKGLIEEITSYNINGKPVYTYTPYISLESLLSEKDKSLNTDQYFSYYVGLCENQINPTEIKNIAYGPNLEQSFYGWFPESSNAYEYWTPRLLLNDLYLPFRWLDFSPHAIDVSKRLMETTLKNELGIIPLGLDACFDAQHMNKVWPELKKANMRVVNLSASESVSKKFCEKMFENHPLITDENVLWVVAAGNYSSPSPNICPQYLSGRKNILIVGASNGNSMQGISSYGPNWVDIAAKEPTTSLATPHVARAAARIFQYFPNLRTEQVRASVLLGAEKPGWSELPVRSGGLVNENRSLSYAELLNKNFSYEEAINQVECGSPTTSCYKAKRKYQLVEELNQ